MDRIKARRVLIGLLISLLTFTALPVLADDGHDYDKGQAFRIGMRNGYNHGYGHGQHDFRRGASFNYKHDKAYRDGDSGYRKEYRHKGDYKDGFREGYRRGYSDGYYRRGYRAPRDGWFGRDRDHDRDHRHDDDYYRRDRDDDYYRRDRDDDYRRRRDDDYERRRRNRGGWWDRVFSYPVN